jgi:hypothetical protein
LDTQVEYHDTCNVESLVAHNKESFDAQDLELLFAQDVERQVGQDVETQDAQDVELCDDVVLNVHEKAVPRILEPEDGILATNIKTGKIFKDVQSKVGDIGKSLEDSIAQPIFKTLLLFARELSSRV